MLPSLATYARASRILPLELGILHPSTKMNKCPGRRLHYRARDALERGYGVKALA